ASATVAGEISGPTAGAVPKAGGGPAAGGGCGGGGGGGWASPCDPAAIPAMPAAAAVRKSRRVFGMALLYARSARSVSHTSDRSYRVRLCVAFSKKGRRKR